MVLRRVPHPSHYEGRGAKIPSQRLAHRVSEQCLRIRLRGSKRGSSDRQKRSVETPFISRGLYWRPVRCVEGTRGAMMPEDAQIGNLGQNLSGLQIII
jgi:hypothetical protein